MHAFFCVDAYTDIPLIQDAAAHLARAADLPAPSWLADRAALEAYVAHHVERLLRESPEQLMQLLYRIDVPEAQFMQALEALQPAAIAARLATRIVDRELQKAASRRKYKNR